MKKFVLVCGAIFTACLIAQQISVRNIQSSEKRGTGPYIQLGSGSVATNHVAKFDSSGNLIDGGLVSSGPIGPTGPQGAPGAAGASGVPGSIGPQGPPFTFRGLWSNGTTYSLGDVVYYNNSSYVSLIGNNLGS